MQSREGIPIIDARGLRAEGEGGFLFPGLWDIHVHGGGGYAFASLQEEEVRGALRAQFVRGTSALLATLPLLAPEALEASLSVLGDVQMSPREGEARLLGVYLEGPFINPEMVGGMEGVGDWSVEGFLSILDRFGPLVRVVTVAPELPEAKRIIPALVERGVVVSLGHTQATEEEALCAFAWGARLVTHLFNAMSPLHHRAPGVALAALLHPMVTVEFIPEVGHLHPMVQRMIVKLKGPDGLLPISDGSPLAAGGPECMSWMGVEIVKRGGATVRRDGRLFGTAITLFDALLFLDQEGIWPFSVSIPALLRNAARLLGEQPAVVTAQGGTIYRFSPGEGLDLISGGSS